MRELVLAVIGAGRLLGRELAAVLRERQFPFRECRSYDSSEYIAGPGDDPDAASLDLLDRANLEGVDVVFLCASELLSVQWAQRALDAGAVAVDLTSAFAEQEDVPLVVPEVNGEVIRGRELSPIVCSPVPGAVALAVSLKPIEEAAQLRRVVVAAFEPVSTADQAGIEELSEQIRALFNGRSVEPKVFPHRIAFNLIPQVGELLAGGDSRFERQVSAQTRRLLDRSDLPISVSSVWVPTFYGHGYAVNVETETPLSAEQARALLREAPGVMLVDEAAANEYPTAADAVGTEAIFVGRIRDDSSAPNALNLWVAIDGTRKGGAVNAVQIAEILARDLA